MGGDGNIEIIKKALEKSPSNLVLRLHLIDLLMEAGEWSEAKIEGEIACGHDPNNFEAKAVLAESHLMLENFSVAIVILDEILEKYPNHEKANFLAARAYFKDGEFVKSQQYYQKGLSLNPEGRVQELDNNFRLSEKAPSIQENQEKVQIERPSLKFEDVGGMDELKEQIELKIIAPLKFPDLYKDYGKKAGGGILMYGPPGCGKTMIARATAGEVGSKFINVGINDILDMWLGNSEKNLHDIFDAARKNAPAVLFFDEVDALGANRVDLSHSSGRNVINQFLNELDGASGNNEDVLILAATNAPWHVDSAFRRPGRFDRLMFVSPPDESARKRIFELAIESKPSENIDASTLAKLTDQYSGADLSAIVDWAIEKKLKQAIKTGVAEPISQQDLLEGINAVKASTSEWFSVAEKYAKHANEAGQYDEILNYIKKNR